MAKMACAKCGGTKMAKGGTAPKKKMAKGGTAEIVGMPQYGNNPRTYSGRMVKKGGAISTINRTVSPGCKGGLVKDENGKCVMERKMAKGGSSSFGMLSVTKGIDKNPGKTYADKIAGATMKKGGLVKKKSNGKR